MAYPSATVSKTKKLLTAGLVAALMSGTASLAQAAEGKALLDQMLASPAMQKVKISWDTVNEQSADSFSMTGVKIIGASGKEETNIGTLNVSGLKETASGRISYDAISLSNIDGNTKKGGRIAIANVVTADGDVPYTIWTDGLTAEEKKERVIFGNFSINGIAVDEGDMKLALESMSLANADIPLDYRFDPKTATEGTPANPLQFGAFAMTGLSGSQAAFNWGLDSFTISNASVPTSLNASIRDWVKLYATMALSGFRVDMNKEQVFAIKTLGSTITPPGDGDVMTSTSSGEGIQINLKAIPDPKTQAIAQQLGYDKVDISMLGTGSYAMSTGRAAVDTMSVKLADMFDLDVGYAVQGYTEEVIRQLQQAQFKIGNGTPPAQAYGEIIPALSQLKLENFKMALTDRSLTGKLLDFQASQMGTTGDQLAGSAPLLIGMGMASLNMPDLTEMVTGAVSKFLKDKGTLTVEAAPADPIPLVNLVIAGQTAPQSVPGLLNLKVAAQ